MSSSPSLPPSADRAGTPRAVAVEALKIIWNPRGYFFWLLVVSLFCFLLERIAPWRKGQKALRPEFGQDLFWLLFNGHFFGLGLAYVAAWVVRQIVQDLEHLAALQKSASA